ncbi:MAG: winged helix-turn-helix transcriptional regulator, partial [Pelolinea sp.]|nr:winged helix-turn-helix transcriptional regulator [Pelolinea sp.]
MKSTREKVLQTLITNPGSTIVDIAKSVGINAISVRHHITSLQANGLVTADEERHGVGRPRLIYSLTESGQENFPKRYLRLTNHLLEQMKNTLSRGDFNRIFENMANDLSSKYESKYLNLGFEEKLDLLKEVMTKEGYDISWVRSDKGYEIKEVACPFYQIGKDHPEICMFDQTLIANMLSIPKQN